MNVTISKVVISYSPVYIHISKSYALSVFWSVSGLRILDIINTISHAQFSYYSYQIEQIMSEYKFERDILLCDTILEYFCLFRGILFIINFKELVTKKLNQFEIMIFGLSLSIL